MRARSARMAGGARADSRAILPAGGRIGAGRARGPAWARLTDDELLELRLADLGLRIEGSSLESRIERLHEELGRAGLRFRPYVYLSSDWFTPDGHTGFAVPFFLAHPRLARLERRQMLEVEGGTQTWCMKLLRHEAAHTLDHAYRLRRRKRWREVFGPASTPYRASYQPRPASRRHVLNLDYWYAQSHPLEDFAETFAVWLQPGSRWRQRYRGWPAHAKLRYVDELMGEIASSRPAVRTRTRPDSVATLRTRLGDYYRRKRAHYDVPAARDYDAYLLRLFSDDPFYARRPRAAGFLARHRRELRNRVASVTGQHVYVVDHVLAEMIPRCRELHLRLTRSERETRMDAAALLTALTMSFVRRRGEYQR